jgi:penicillin amidase
MAARSSPTTCISGCACRTSGFAPSCAIRTVVTGVTLPGTPFVVVGSNGQIAWGFTNSYGDWMDFIELRLDAAAPERYLTAQGWRQIEKHEEVIAVRGGPSETLEVKETVFGPLVAQSSAGIPLALMWTAHYAEAVNTGLADMEGVGTIEQALAVAQQAGIPVQNLLLASADGRIAWTPMGRIPRRASNYDPRLPADWSAPGSGWQSWYEGAEVPRVVDPESGRLWTANARTVDGEALHRLGDGGYTIGARAGQIRDQLLAHERVTETDLYAVQLDDRALFLERWHELLSATLKDREEPELKAMLAALADWDGHASPHSRAYRIVRDFRLRVHARFLQLFDAPLREVDPAWVWPSLPQIEGAVWRTLSERPAYLLPRNFPSWDDWLLACAHDSLKRLDQYGLQPDAASWGLQNATAIRHPLSRALPGMGWLLDMPREELPGDQYMPRVQGPTFGASERMVVSPGREEDGILQMPGGQSGHPLSPYYGAGHSDWARGKPTPFLPGKVEHRIELTPQ